MKKRISSRGIILEDNCIVAMFRRKIKDDGNIKEYYVIPGGELEENETLEENVIRELKEEFSVDIKILGYLGVEEDEKNKTHFFHCKKTNGEYNLGGPEKERNTKNNYYEIIRLGLDKINDVDISYKNMIEKAVNGEYL